jgi:hypothetical protein
VEAITVYFDWNVYNKIESIASLPGEEKIVFRKIEDGLLTKRFVSPYSNAHISDLIRGYVKKTDYIDGHLQTLQHLTSNLCITQYWGEPRVRWHIRDIRAYFHQALNDKETEQTDYYKLYEELDDSVLGSLADMTFKLYCDGLKLKPIPSEFKQIYQADPIFSTIFPRTKQEMNEFALHEDLFTLRQKLSSDYVLYENFNKYLNSMKSKYPNFQKLPGMQALSKRSTGVALTWDNIWEDLSPDFKQSSNPMFDQLFNRFVTADLSGYKRDERFANLCDDALHTFYGAHCMYFVTMDERCLAKEQLVYKQFAKNVKALKPLDFVNELNL